MHELLAAQLSRFQSKGGNLPHMSSPAAWVNLHSKCALEWWTSWGQEVPELQRLACKIVPLLIGSGPAERTWKDVDSILTKKRNRLKVQTALDILYVRTWLRREIKIVSDEELEMFKTWETELLHRAEFYDGEIEPVGRVRERRIFEDRIEDWELNATDGSGPGPRIALGQVKRNGAAKFRLQEKYKGLYFIDKDPDGRVFHLALSTHPQTTLTHPAMTAGEHGYYVDGVPAPADEWENRKIIGIVWEQYRG